MSYNECKGCKHDENRNAIGTALEFCTYCKRASDDKFHRMHHKDLFKPSEVTESEIKPYKGEYRCPECDTYNGEWKKREKAVKEYFVDIVYCWHCGCKVQITGHKK